jgi:hypothetical protein
MKFTNFLFLAIITLLFSCQSAKEKENERLNKESTEIFSNAIAEAKANGFTFSYDSLMKDFAQKMHDNPSTAFEYANKFKSAISTLKNQQSTAASNDTTKYFEIKLVKKEVYVGSAKFDFEIKNLLDKPIEEFSLKASLRNKNGDYLADELYLTWKNIRPGGIGIESTWWADIKLNDVGGILLIPHELKINGQDFNFTGDNISILENKLGVKLSF